MARITPSARFDTTKLLAALGRHAEFAARCAERNLQPPGESTYRMWKQRGRIPGEWVPTVLLTIPEDTNLRFYVAVEAAESTPVNPFA